jgi:hypothetical protein
MRSPALALGWQLWSRKRVIRWTFLGFAAGMIAIAQAFARDESVATAICLSFVAVTLMTGLVTSWSLESQGTITETPAFPRWMLTLPVRTEALVGWPMVYGTVFVALAWPVWVWLVLGPSRVPAPLFWPACLFAAIVAWFQVLTLPARRSLRRTAGNCLVMGSLVAGIILLVEQCLEFRGEKPLLVAGTTALPEAGLAAGFAALLAVAYPVGVAGLAAFRRGDVRRRKLVPIDGAWLSAWLPQPSGPFSSPARAQLWLEWRLRGATLPSLWLACQACLLLGGAIVLFVMHGAAFVLLPDGQGFDAADVRRDIWREAWWLLPLVVCFLIPQFAPASGIDWENKLRLVGTLPPLIAMRPINTGAMVLARLQAVTLGLLLMWVLVVGEAGVLFLIGGERADVTAFVARHFPGWNDLAFLAVITVGGFLFLWKQLAQTMFFGLTGHWWTTLVATVIHSLAMWLLFVVVCWFMGSPEASQEWLRQALPWLTGLAGLALVLKLVAVAWAVQANYQRQLLSGGTLLRLVGLWLATVVGFTFFVVALMPSGLVSLPWIAGGVALALPFARILFAPLVLAWNRHR